MRHPPVRQTGVVELGTVRGITEALVETDGMRLRRQGDNSQSSFDGTPLDRRDKGDAEAAPPRNTQDGEAPQVANRSGRIGRTFEAGWLDDQAPGTHGKARVVVRQEMVGGRVEIVELEVRGHALLPDEHLAADRVGGRDLVGLGRETHDAHYGVTSGEARPVTARGRPGSRW
jgi:hypothetical protein